MIVKCKICGGNGLIQSGDPFGNIFGRDRRPCPSCKGAGEFDLNIPQERLTICKFCGGRGIIRSAGFDLFEEMGSGLDLSVMTCYRCIHGPSAQN